MARQAVRHDPDRDRRAAPRPRLGPPHRLGGEARRRPDLVHEVEAAGPERRHLRQLPGPDADHPPPADGRAPQPQHGQRQGRRIGMQHQRHAGRRRLAPLARGPVRHAQRLQAVQHQPRPFAQARCAVQLPGDNQAGLHGQGRLVGPGRQNRRRPPHRRPPRLLRQLPPHAVQWVQRQEGTVIRRSGGRRSGGPARSPSTAAPPCCTVRRHAGTADGSGSRTAARAGSGSRP